MADTTNPRPDAATAPAKKKPAEPVPATPRKRVPGARTLVTASASIRDAIAGTCGKAVYAYALAQIQVLQDDSDLREEAPMFDNGGDDAPEKPWQTFENLVSDAPEKAVVAPITIMTDVKMGLASLFIAIADLVNAVGKLPAQGPVGALCASPAREANVVQLMAAAVAPARHILRADPLSRDLDFPLVFRQKLEALVSSKTLVDPGAEAIARLFTDFLKVVAWRAAVRAYEQGHLTLNRAAFLDIVAGLGITVAEASVPVVRDVLNLLRSQLEAWEAAAASKAAKTKKAPAKKAAVKAPAKAPAKAAPAKGAVKGPAKGAVKAAPAEKKEATAPVAPAEATPPAPGEAEGSDAGPAETDVPADATPVDTAPVPAKAVPAKKTAAEPGPALEYDYDQLLETVQDAASQ